MEGPIEYLTNVLIFAKKAFGGAPSTAPAVAAPAAHKKRKQRVLAQKEVKLTKKDLFLEESIKPGPKRAYHIRSETSHPRILQQVAPPVAAHEDDEFEDDLDQKDDTSMTEQFQERFNWDNIDLDKVSEMLKIQELLTEKNKVAMENLVNKYVA